MSARRPPPAVLCRRCRRLVARDEVRCPHCGALRPAALSGLGRVGGLLAELDPPRAILGAIVGLYVVALALDPRAAFSARGLLSVGAPSDRALYLLGMTGGWAVVCGQWWTLLSAGFLHGGVLHILFNAMWVRSLGPVVNRVFGGRRFLVIYLLTGAAGFALSDVATGAPTIGASASIFGLMGALAAWGRRAGGRIGEAVSRDMLKWGAILFVMGFMLPGVNNWAHAGGFLTGLALGWPLARSRGEGRLLGWLAAALVVATAGAVLASVITWWPHYGSGLPPCAVRAHR